MALTPEEQKELEALENEFSQSRKTSNLSPEEQAELSSLEEEFGRNASAQPSQKGFAPGQTHMVDPETNRVVSISEDQLNDGPSQEEAIIQGAGNIPGIKPLAAGLASVYSMKDATELSLEGLKMRYDIFRDGTREADKAAKESHPEYYMGGDIVANIALAAAKPVTATIKGAGLIAGARGFQDTEESVFEEPLENATNTIIGGLIGSASQLGGDVAGKGIKAGLAKTVALREKIGVFALRRTGKYTQTQLLDLAEKHYGASAKDVNKIVDLDEAYANITNDIVNDGWFKAGVSSGKRYQNAKVSKKLIGEKIKKFINKADDVLSKVDDSVVDANKASIGVYSEKASGVIDGEDMFRSLQLDTRDVLEDASVPPEAKKFIVDTIDSFRHVDKNGVPVPRLMSLKTFHSRLQSLDNSLSSLTDKVFKGNASPVEKHQMLGLSKITTRMRDRLHAEVDASGVTIDGLDWVQVKKAYGRADFMSKVSHNLHTSTNELTWVDRVRDAVGFRTLAAFGVGKHFAGAPGGVAMVFADKAMNNPSTPQKAMAGVGMIEKLYQKDPNHPAFRKFAAIMMDDQVYGEALENGFATLLADASLTVEPLERTTQGLIDNANSISTMLSKLDPELDKQFRDAVESGDEGDLEIAGMALTQIPQAKKYIKPGIGFNGKITNEEEKKMLLDELDSNQELSHMQRLLRKEQVNRGLVPPPPQAEQPRFLQWKSNQGEDPEF